MRNPSAQIVHLRPSRTSPRPHTQIVLTNTSTHEDDSGPTRHQAHLTQEGVECSLARSRQAEHRPHVSPVHHTPPRPHTQIVLTDTNTHEDNSGSTRHQAYLSREGVEGLLVRLRQVEHHLYVHLSILFSPRSSSVPSLRILLRALTA
jgi:hypothetical protein